MPAGLKAIRHALADRLNTLPGVTATPYLSDAINAPHIWVEPDRPFVDYEKVWETRQVAYKFLLTILVNRFDEASSQDELDDYLDVDGELVTLLHNPDGLIEDDLSAITSYVTIQKATRYGAYSVGGTTYLGAQLMVDVYA